MGKKLSMTQIFRENGEVVPVTRIQAGPCIVTYVRNKEKDGVSAIQLGFGEQKLFRLSRPLQGHLQGLPALRYLHDVSIEEGHALKRGDTITASVFHPGDHVTVTGTSKGKGFQGVVKRHGFRGGPASHGHKDNLRMPGSIGSQGPQRVFKGTRMGGHMGDETVTVKNLEVVSVDPERNELLVKGAVPGARNGFVVLLSSEGTMEAHESLKQISPVEDAAPIAEQEVLVSEPAETAPVSA